MGFLEFLNEGRVIGDAGDDGHVFKVFSGGADHGGTADIDVLDEVTEGNAGLGRGFFKGVEIDDHHIDGLNAVGGDGSFMLGIAADIEQAAVDLGMQGFDAAIQHFREAGQVADVLHAEAGVAQGARGAAGGDQLYAKTRQYLGKLHQARLVGNAQQRAPNLLLLIDTLTHSSAPHGPSLAPWGAGRTKTKLQSTSKQGRRRAVERGGRNGAHSGTTPARRLSHVYGEQPPFWKCIKVMLWEVTRRFPSRKFCLRIPVTFRRCISRSRRKPVSDASARGRPRRLLIC